jgi:hypothetical protein
MAAGRGDERCQETVPPAADRKPAQLCGNSQQHQSDIEDGIDGPSRCTDDGVGRPVTIECSDKDNGKASTSAMTAAMPVSISVTGKHL